MAILSCRRIPLAILLYEKFKHLTDHFTSKHTAFEHSAACLSVVLELLPGVVTFAILWHTRRILDKNVNVNKSYNYPTTLWQSISTQIYVFLVLF